MVLTGFTAIMAAALGGAVAVDATVLVVVAVVALVVLGAINGVKALRKLTGYVRTWLPGPCHSRRSACLSTDVDHVTGGIDGI